MKCPVCIDKDMKSLVYDHGGTTTLAAYTPYYDEDGKYHNHDSNIISHSFKCSNGHRWSEQSTGSCWCGWNKDIKPIVNIIDDGENKDV